MSQSAPVYRNLDGRQTVLGLEVPLEFCVWLALLYPAVVFLTPGLSTLSILGSYILIRLAGRGKPPQFWPHFVQWYVRRLIAGGYLSAAARAQQPRFPFAPLDFRDARPLAASQAALATGSADVRTPASVRNA